MAAITTDLDDSLVLRLLAVIAAILFAFAYGAVADFVCAFIVVRHHFPPVIELKILP